jgi:ABC-2 type transport system ATP-binding protein
MSIEFRDVRRSYGTLHALDGLDLSIPSGSVYGLIGPNGAGKTTAMRIVCQLDRSYSGTVEVLEHRLPDRSVKERIGYMPQELALYPTLTVWENLDLFGEIYMLKASLRRTRGMELLRDLHLEERENSLVDELSGGMKRRLSLACAMIHEPELLLLDEPTVGVDPRLRVNLWNRFRNLADAGKTVVITTHYMDEAHNCDVVGLISEGKLLASGSPNALISQAGVSSLEDAFLELSAPGMAEKMIVEGSA